jgi:hypothetical protein
MLLTIILINESTSSLHSFNIVSLVNSTDLSRAEVDRDNRGAGLSVER